MTEDARLAELLGSLSLATDLAAGLPRETALRTSLIAVRLAAALGVQGFELQDVFYAGLLRFLGCSAHSYEMAQRYAAGDDLSLLRELTRADADHPSTIVRGALRGVSRRQGTRRRLAGLARLASSPEAPRELFQSHCELAVLLARRLGMSEGVIDTLGQMYERWDGKGFPEGRSGTQIRRSARILQVAWRMAAHGALDGPIAALRVVRQRRSREFDPELADCALSNMSRIRVGVDAPSAWSAFLEAEPKPWLRIPRRRLEDAAVVFGHFSDVKSPWTAGHSGAVAELAVASARRAGVAEPMLSELRCAALLHDVGRVAVPNGVWDKPGPLDAMERELAESHAQETARILGRSPLLERLARLATSAHERLDGSGYPGRHEAPALPDLARLLAAADVYRALSEARPHRPAYPAPEAARLLAAEADAKHLCPHAVDALLAAVGEGPLRAAGEPRPASPAPTGRARPSTPCPEQPRLSGREVEILRLVARGLGNKELARALFISPATVKRHLENIFDKIGVRTRAAVTVWALERGYL